LVIAPRPPHNAAGEAAPMADRWRMLELATSEANSTSSGVVLEPCDIEMRRDAPSFTVDTLAQIAEDYPDADLFLILGADAYAEIDSWSRPAEIPALSNIIVTTRPGWRDTGEKGDRQAPGVHAVGFSPRPPVAARTDARYDPVIGVYVHTSGHTIHGHRIRGIEASSSEIRSRVRKGLPVEHLTGDGVARYIHDHHLYEDLAAQPASSSPSNKPS
jgi:nicotinate-nucleotide adenylyltransferase